jgi:hypothetical protein
VRIKTKLLSTLVLLIILVIPVWITPNLAAGQMTSTLQQKANTDPNEKANSASPERLAISMALKYLSILGYKSPAIVQFNANECEVGVNGVGTFNVLDNGRITTVQVTSNFLFEKGSSDYEYNAQFTLKNGTTNSVEECFSEIINGGQVEATFTQKISGSIDFSVSAVQETTLDKQMTKTTDINIEFSNSTGTYFARCQSKGMWSSDGTEVVNGSLTIDQNIFSQRGRYVYSFSPKADSLGTKCLMTKPDGDVVDPDGTLYISTDGDYSSHLDVYLIGFTSQEQSQEGFVEALVGLILYLLSNTPQLAFLSAVLAPLGGLLALLGVLTAGSQYLYTSSMDGLLVLYIKFVSLRWTGAFLWQQHKLTLFAEIGFYTDQYEWEPLGNWYYYPLFNSLLFLPNNDPYTCDWSFAPDPYVTFQGYDESTSTYVDGVPIYINGTVAGVTCSTLFLTPGTYIVQVPNYGGDSFHYFDVDGVPVYDNPATITVPEEDFTIGIHYYYMPYDFVGSITGYDGAVSNPSGLIGSPPDGLFAGIDGYGPYQYYGWISGAMSAETAGHIYVYGSGNGPLYVYVSSDGSNFDLVSTPYVNSGSPYWIDCGTYPSSFNYIAVTAEDWNYIYSISLDSVKVEPPQ